MRFKYGSVKSDVLGQRRSGGSGWTQEFEVVFSSEPSPSCEVENVIYTTRGMKASILDISHPPQRRLTFRGGPSCSAVRNPRLKSRSSS